MKGRILVIAVVWLLLLGCGAMLYKWLYRPAQEKKVQQAVEYVKKQKLEATSSDSVYKHHITFALDSFSGYAIFRSQEFQNELRSKSIKLDLHDDGADYPKRLKGLQAAETDMAVFTIDALIKTSDALHDLPAVIVAISDETKGADAMVGYTAPFPNVDSLNHPDTKFVLTPNSPSETLSRVVMAYFNLDQTDVNNIFINAKDASDVYAQYKASKPNSHEVYVLWEPYVSKVLENPETHVIIDSSRFKGYIVDVIVANRDFLYKNPDLVKSFIECYFKTGYNVRDNMSRLIQDDSRSLKMAINDAQLKHLIAGIWWKNTQENFAHFGLFNERPLQHIEDMVVNLTNVLMKTGAIHQDPTGGNPNKLYYADILHKIQESGFHPGAEDIRNQQTELPILTENQWTNLIPVGTLDVEQLVFPRGKANLTERSHVILDDLIVKLKPFPMYYIVVRGTASAKLGDPELNKELAENRAKAAKDYMVEHGINTNRIKAEGKLADEMSVKFIFGQTPY